MGHSDITTTMGYIAVVDEEDIESALDALTPDANEKPAEQ